MPKVRFAVPTVDQVPVPTGASVTMKYETQDGTAVAPTDYTAKTGTLTFGAGDTVKYVEVDVQPNVALNPKALNLRIFDVEATGNVDPSIVTSTAPGVIPRGEDDSQKWRDRYIQLWDMVFNPDNQYLSYSAKTNTGKCYYGPAFHTSQKDSLILVEDRLAVNSVSTSAAMISEDAVYMDGFVRARDLIINDPWRTTNIERTGMGTGPGIYNHIVGAQFGVFGLIPNTTRLYDQPYGGAVQFFNKVQYEPSSLSAYPPAVVTTEPPQDVDGSVRGLLQQLGNAGDMNLSSSTFYYSTLSNQSHYNTVLNPYGDYTTVEHRGPKESVWQTVTPDLRNRYPGMGVTIFAPDALGLRYPADYFDQINGYPDSVRIGNYYRTINDPFAELTQAQNLFRSVKHHYAYHKDQNYPLYQSESQGGGASSALAYLKWFPRNVLNKDFKTIPGDVEERYGTQGHFGLVNMSFEVENIGFQDIATEQNLATGAIYHGTNDVHHLHQNLYGMSRLLLQSGPLIQDFNQATSPNSVSMLAPCMETMPVFLRWLQSPEGPFAGGATCSYKGQYATPTDGRQNAKFEELYYTYAPGKVNPPSNNRVEWQTLGRMSMADYYLDRVEENDAAFTQFLEIMLDRFVKWFLDHTTVSNQGVISVPTRLSWTSATQVQGQTATVANTEGTFEYLPTMPVPRANELLDPDNTTFWNATTVPNPNLHCSITASGQDLTIASSLAYILIVYGKAKKRQDKLDTAIPGSTKTPQDAVDLAKSLLDAIWDHYRDTIGIKETEVCSEYNKFNTALNIPAGMTIWSCNGKDLNSSSTFIDSRDFLKSDKRWADVQAYLSGGSAPTFIYHRTRVQALYGQAIAAYHLHFVM